ncbi:MAG: mechanosensitive ion channel domain-containing protein [Microcystaceae cyanobacterium]
MLTFSNKIIKLIILGCLTALIILVPSIAFGQFPSTTVSDDSSMLSTDKAWIVVDGQPVFKVGNFGNYTAQQRANIINQGLAQEVLTPQPIELRILQENQQIILQNQTTERYLLTVTESDVISASSLFGQALIWQNKLESLLKKAQYQRTAPYLRQATVIALVLFLITSLLQCGFLAFRHWSFPRLLSQVTTPQRRLYAWRSPLQIVLKLIELLFPVILWLTSLFYIANLFPKSRIWYYQFFNLLREPIATFGEQTYSALELLWLAILTIGLWFVVKGVTLLLTSYLLKPSGVSQSIQSVITTLIQYLLTFMGLIILWQLWGFDLAAFTILASVLGVGIGFGLQNIANNFISGLIITVERPIKVGDFIQIGDLKGTVQKIGARSTTIKTFRQISIIVPNGRFLENEVINWSYNNPVSAIMISVGVAYGSPVKKVKAALLEAAQGHKDVLITPRPKVLFQEFGDSSLNFELMVWIKTPRLQFLVQSDLNYRIEENLRRYGLEVPFPQQDLHIRSPQLEQVMSVWLKKQDVSVEDEISSLKDPSILSDAEAEARLSELSEEPFLLEDRLSSTDMEEMIAKMRSSEGVSIQDRRYRLNLYPNCFVGSEAVDWLAQHYTCSRPEAIELGQILIERGIIHHVTDGHPFEDDYLFYRFYEDEVS